MFQFLNQSLVWLLALVIVPIIIHLFNFKKRKKVFFTNTWFLKSVRNKTKSYSNLKKLIVLFLRILFITWIVIAVLNPVFKVNSEDSPKAEVTYLDTSPSMSVSNDNGVELLMMGADFLRMDDNQQQSMITNQNIFTSLDNLSLGLETDGRPNNFELVNSQVTAKYASSKWLSDFQMGKVKIEDIITDTTHQYELIVMPQNVDSNLSIDSVFLSKPLGYGTSNSLEIVITHSGNQTLQDQIITVEKDNRQLATIPFSIGANTQENVILKMSENELISGNYKLILDDTPMSFDNEFYFRVANTKQLRVLIIHSQVPNKNLLGALGNKEIFDLRVKKIIDVSNEDIQKCDFVVMDHIQSFPDWIVAELNVFTGAVLVIPSGLDIDKNSYQTLLNSSITIKSALDRSKLSSKSLSNPLFKGLFDDNENFSLPLTSVIVTPESNRYNTVFACDNGERYITRDDNFFLLGSALNQEQTSIMDHALFVPLIYSIAMEGMKNVDLFYKIGRKQITLNQFEGDLGLFRLNGTTEEYVLNMNQVGNVLLFEIPEDVSHPGFYFLTHQKDTVATIAMNLPTSESIVDFYDVEELKMLFSKRKNVKVSSISEAIKLKNEDIIRGDQIPLWKYALILSLIFLLAEICVLRFMK